MGGLGEFNCFSWYTVLSVGAVELLQWECKSQAGELFVLVPLACEQSLVPSSSAPDSGRWKDYDGA